MAIITTQLLHAAGACSNQIAEFELRFGTSAEVTEDACESVSHVFDYDWAASNLLSLRAWREFLPIKIKARQEYERITDIAFQRIQRAKPNTSEYETLWKEYGIISNKAWDNYQRIKVRAFARCYAKN